MIKNIIKTKKAQEEIVGFVLIIVLVAVVFVIFLGIFLRQPAKEYPSEETQSFLHSSLIYTTECRPSPEIVYNLKDLIKACSNNENCQNLGKDACIVLKEVYEKLIEKSFQVGNETKYKGYELKIYDTRKPEEVKIEIKKPNTEIQGNMIGARIIPAALENYEISLKLYY